MKRLMSLCALLCLAAAVSGAQPSAASKTFERIRGLSGDWEGSLEWSGARSGTGRVRATYRETGFGSAVVEDLIMDEGSVPSMTSVYHLDGSDLRMTHFCGAANQPRLKASGIDEGQGIVQFSFVDATGLAEHPAHVVAFEMRFLPGGRLALLFTFDAAGKRSVEHIELERARHAMPPTP